MEGKRRYQKRLSGREIRLNTATLLSLADLIHVADVCLHLDEFEDEVLIRLPSLNFQDRCFQKILPHRQRQDHHQSIMKKRKA